VRRVTAPRWLSATLVLFPLGGACGAPPAASPLASEPSNAPAQSGKRRTDIAGDCDQLPGQPPPEPLRIQYTGVAKAAQCQREVFTIMGGVTHFLGVECKHCHQEPDYAADTHNKQIANWMARELVPRLQRRAAGAEGSREVWCKDCHAGKPKLLGDPRRRDLAVEWMTTHLVEDFSTIPGNPPKCKECHGGDLGSPQFRAKVILEALPGLPAPATAAEPAAAEPAPLSPVPDFGKR
jgi:hypothetical protein